MLKIIKIWHIKYKTKGRNILEKTGIILGVISAIMHLFAFILYNIQSGKNRSQPNIVTWGIGAFLGVIMAFSYLDLSKDPMVSLQFFSNALALLITFFLSLFTGKFTWPDGGEWIAIFIGLISGMIWLVFKAAVAANLILFFAFIIAYIPTFLGVCKDPRKESSPAWTVWAIAFMLNSIAVIFRWKAQPAALIPPSVAFIAHAAIAILSTTKRKIKFAQKPA